MIGIPDKKWTERPLLVVVPHPKSKPSKDELLQFLKVRRVACGVHVRMHCLWTHLTQPLCRPVVSGIHQRAMLLSHEQQPCHALLEKRRERGCALHRER